MFETIDIVSENHAMRVATGVLNEIMAEAVAMQQPPSDKGKRLRLYYITQVAVKPPTFSDDKPEGSTLKTKGLPDLILNISGIGEMHQFLIQDKGNRYP